MNYIKKMEADLGEAHKAIFWALETLNDQRVHLLRSPKFTGVESDGGRKDWISTSDVVAWIDWVRGEIIDRAPSRCLEKL